MQLLKNVIFVYWAKYRGVNLIEISGVDLIAREARFHEQCRKAYIRQEDRQHHKISMPDEDDREDTFYHSCVEQCKAYDAAFEHVCKYISQHIIQNGSVVCMTTVREIYLQFIQENSPYFYNPQHKMQKLKDKIVRHFGPVVQFWQPNVKSELLFSGEVSAGAAVEVAFEAATSEAKLLDEAAMTIWRHIIHARATSPDLAWPPSAEYLNTGPVSPPNVLVDFMARIITRKPPAMCNQRSSRLLSSLSEDMCAAATCSRWQMPKHLLLGMTVHHLTGSAQLITLLHRFGHCCSYSQVLELENAVAFQSLSRQTVLPSNISVDGNKFSHFFFDNFDILEQTASGAGTTYYTHGIVIQELKPAWTGNDVAETSVPITKQTIKIIIDALPDILCPRRVEPTFCLPVPAGIQVESFSPPCTTTAVEHAWVVCHSKFNHKFTVGERSGWLSSTSKVSAPPAVSAVSYRLFASYSVSHHRIQHRSPVPHNGYGSCTRTESEVLLHHNGLCSFSLLRGISRNTRLCLCKLSCFNCFHLSHLSLLILIAEESALDASRIMLNLYLMDVCRFIVATEQPEVRELFWTGCYCCTSR
jgi:hypothetical protein